MKSFGILDCRFRRCLAQIGGNLEVSGEARVVRDSIFTIRLEVTAGNLRKAGFVCGKHLSDLLGHLRKLRSVGISRQKTQNRSDEKGQSRHESRDVIGIRPLLMSMTQAMV